MGLGCDSHHHHTWSAHVSSQRFFVHVAFSGRKLSCQHVCSVFHVLFLSLVLLLETMRCGMVFPTVAIIAVVLVCFAEIMEGIQSASSGLSDDNLSDDNIAKKSYKLTSGKSRQTFMIGRQALTNSSFFLLEEMTTWTVVPSQGDATIFGVSDGAQQFFNTGLLGALVTTILSSLAITPITPAPTPPVPNTLPPNTPKIPAPNTPAPTNPPPNTPAPTPTVPTTPAPTCPYQSTSKLCSPYQSTSNHSKNSSSKHSSPYHSTSNHSSSKHSSHYLPLPIHLQTLQPLPIHLQSPQPLPLHL
jgi:Silicon transporter